ncbi:MAG: EAL domain-containing protein [Lachnospira sp.]|nr:EAL domain-containing protein [Lachnospira sp.]
MTNIVNLLDKDGTFMEIVEEIIHETQKYLCTSHAAILQISVDNSWINSVISYVGEDEEPLPVTNMAIERFHIDGEELRCCNMSTATEQERKTLQYMGIKSMVIAPVFINDIRVMYFAVMDVHSIIEYNKEQLKFISDVVNIIQAIAQKKVTKNSLLSSYEVLKAILNSIGSGIIVFGRTDGNIFFENDIAQNIEEVNRTASKAVKEFLRMTKRRTKLLKPMEHYDPQSGLWFEVKFSDLTWIDGSAVSVCTIMDITQKKKNQQKIEYQANNDFLTGIYNRMKCEADLRTILKQAVEEDIKGAVMFLDLDDFKHINDGLGHQYGDVLLQQIAAGLQGVPGLRGHCYRMGGDEFLVIIPPNQYNNLDRIVENVIAMFNKPWYLMGTEYFCTMSMGIATFPDNSSEVHELVKMADTAMYDAKKSGKNRYSFYDSKKDVNTIKRLDIENNMRQAIATQIQEFIVFFQPVVDIQTRKCVSCEALVRWDSKTLGFMGPGDFVPLAEYLGLITDIGDYVLEEACKQCKLWNDMGYKDFHINVNLSVVQLLQKDVVKNVREIFDRTGVNPCNIVLEITESFAINDMDRVMKIIDGLKELGPEIALDDFGTGYSSLNYIKQLPLNIIKVDKTFIDDIVEDEYAQAFIKLIVDLSKTIKTEIVVEGIEDIHQFQLLKEIGVDYIQGYFFGKPVDAEKFEEMYLGKVLGKEAL